MKSISENDAASPKITDLVAASPITASLAEASTTTPVMTRAGRATRLRKLGLKTRPQGVLAAAGITREATQGKASSKRALEALSDDYDLPIMTKKPRHEIRGRSGRFVSANPAVDWAVDRIAAKSRPSEDTTAKPNLVNDTKAESTPTNHTAANPKQVKNTESKPIPNDDAAEKSNLQCRGCRGKKSKCTKDFPSCRQCIEAGKSCTYPRLVLERLAQAIREKEKVALPDEDLEERKDDQGTSESEGQEEEDEDEDEDDENLPGEKSTRKCLKCKGPEAECSKDLPSCRRCIEFGRKCTYLTAHQAKARAERKRRARAMSKEFHKESLLENNDHGEDEKEEDKVEEENEDDDVEEEEEEEDEVEAEEAESKSGPAQEKIETKKSEKKGAPPQIPKKVARESDTGLAKKKKVERKKGEEKGVHHQPLDQNAETPVPLSSLDLQDTSKHGYELVGIFNSKRITWTTEESRRGFYYQLHFDDKATGGRESGWCKIAQLRDCKKGAVLADEFHERERKALRPTADEIAEAGL